MRDGAVLIASGLWNTPFAKTSHGLVRGPSRFDIAAVVDPTCTGRDAGEMLDGVRRDVPIVASVAEALAAPRPDGRGEVRVAVVGVATVGGVLPASVRAALVEAAGAGLDLVNGLHQPLADDPEIAAAVERGGVRVLDFRRPRPTSELRFWSGEVLGLDVPRFAVLGIDCAIGKRTTTSLLHQALRARGARAEVIYTGQTGWLQGYRYGFLFDATPNDFVSGELEGAILACARAEAPDVILIEGQSGLRNPSGPCGAELLLSAAVHGALLQVAPGRTHYEGLEDVGAELPPIADEVELIRRYGVDVLAVTVNDEALDDAEATRADLERELGLPVVLPLRRTGGELRDLERVVDVLLSRSSSPR